MAAICRLGASPCSMAAGPSLAELALMLALEREAGASCGWLGSGFCRPGVTAGGGSWM